MGNGYEFRIAKKGESFDIEGAIDRANRARVRRLGLSALLDAVMVLPSKPWIPPPPPHWIHEWDVP